MKKFKKINNKKKLIKIKKNKQLRNMKFHYKLKTMNQTILKNKLPNKIYL